MLVKITAKRQVTFPSKVLQAMGVKPGDRLEVEAGPDGFILRPCVVDRSLLAPLRGKLKRGVGGLDLGTFRELAFQCSRRCRPRAAAACSTG